jgi:rhodanese-related sulfurtransferase
MPDPKTMSDFVSDAMGRISEIAVEEVQKKLRDGETVLLVDVREGEEFQRGHVPGAMLVPRGVLEGVAPRVLPDRDAEIVAYCGSGQRSALAADTLQQMGYTRVRSMAGGFRDWQQSGAPVNRSP